MSQKYRPTQNTHTISKNTNTPTLTADATNLQKDATSLREELPTFLQDSRKEEKEGLEKIIGIGGQSASGNRTTAQERKYLKLQSEIEEQLATISFFLVSIPATYKDGLLLAMRTTNISDSLMSVARQNDRFYEALNKAMTLSVWTALIGEGIMLSAGILANHGIYPLSFIGIKPPVQKDDLSPAEFSEEQRAQIFMNLMNRQASMKEAANDPTTL